MTAERHELHELVDELPEDPVASALTDVRRRLPRSEGKAWAPEFFGIVDGAELPADLATSTDGYRAASGFGGDSLLSWSVVQRHPRGPYSAPASASASGPERCARHRTLVAELPALV